LDPFEAGRARALGSLMRDLEAGRVDPDIVPLLSLLNSSPRYYTTSSCSGRIQLAATRLPGEKFRMVVVAKWHRPLQPRELREVLAASRYPDLWMAVQGPILHVACRSLEAALALLEAARRAGLKHSGIQGLGERVMVELLSSDRIEAPLRLGGVDVMRGRVLDEFVERANEVLLRAKSRLDRLAAELQKVLGGGEERI